METVQAKLQENISKGSLNSLERLARTLQSDTPVVPVENNNNSSMDVDESNAAPIKSHTFKNVAAFMSNKQMVLNSTHSKKHSMPFAPGTTGARLARKIVSKRNRRGQVSIGVGIVKKHKIKANKK